MARTRAELSVCGTAVRENDPDRFFCTLFARQEEREALFALYTFNHELARVAESVSEPMLGQIRLQWWRESLDGIEAGTPRRHDTVDALAERVHHDFVERLKFAKIWGEEGHDGQQVGRDHVLHEGDMVELHA